MSTASGARLSFPALVGLFTVFGVLACMVLAVSFSMFYYSADLHRSGDVEKQLLEQTENYPPQKTTVPVYLTRSEPPSAAVTRGDLIDVKGGTPQVTKKPSQPPPPPPHRPVSHRSDSDAAVIPTLSKNDPSSFPSGARAVGDRMTREEAETVLAKYRWLKQKDRATKQNLIDADLI
ncbi:hypothetical protein K435DRAFT_778942 [Dendrothele bispora CBS 962.96]|uniref:Uncharacterized protein n=1 Tax=Dendrothele bispora (strain CBS 962.96) TaxID=1314807 RepID=A0A4S8M0J3_DENBC|nr:hypothetical protein K435DRAFT_778942 [Dendrothele bispora CBS 962.96]